MANFIGDGESATMGAFRTIAAAANQMNGLDDSSSVVVLPRGVDAMEVNFERLEEMRTAKDNKMKYTELLRGTR